jgi:hypothetical protein
VFQALQTREIMVLGVLKFGDQNIVMIADWVLVLAFLFCED